MLRKTILLLCLITMSVNCYSAEKPEAKTLWTNATPANRLEPGGSKKNTGYVAGERPGFKTWNWLIYDLGLWTDYLEVVTDLLNVSTDAAGGYIGQTGTVIIGTSTLNDGQLIIFGTMTVNMLTSDEIISSTITVNEKLFFQSTNTYITSPSTSNNLEFFVGNNKAFTVLPSNDVAVESGGQFFLDGGTDTYIYESASDNIRFVVGDNIAFEIDPNADCAAHNDLVPAQDDVSFSALGTAAKHWYGLWYGAGGLNQKPCFRNLKKNVVFKNIKNKYVTLPKFGDFKYIDDESEDLTKTGFIIDDDYENSSNYSYINADGSMSLTKMIAQMSICIKELNERIETLESQ